MQPNSSYIYSGQYGELTMEELIAEGDHAFLAYDEEEAGAVSRQ
jgi:hypothetical protein